MSAPVLPDLQLDLLALPRAVSELRRTVHEYLGVPCADVQLCVTELIGNVIRHVGEGTPVRVRLSLADGRIRVEVTDPAPHALPVLLNASEDDESGRGLALLDAVVLRWGVEPSADGKTVWCELDDLEGGAVRERRTSSGEPVARMVPFRPTVRHTGRRSLRGRIHIPDGFDELPDDIAGAFGMR